MVLKMVYLRVLTLLTESKQLFRNIFFMAEDDAIQIFDYEQKFSTARQHKFFYRITLQNFGN